MKVSSAAVVALLGALAASVHVEAVVPRRCKSLKRKGKMCMVPTRKPTRKPRKPPTAKPVPQIMTPPTKTPTGRPTNKPSLRPTKSPTAAPTSAPTGPKGASSSPTFAPTSAPTNAPTAGPTALPTAAPTSAPTSAPTGPKGTASPTFAPTSAPTNAPTAGPTALPTAAPTRAPTSPPTKTKSPTDAPTGIPTSKPTDKPTRFPTTTPTTAKPTNFPTPNPTAKPTNPPTSAPTFATVNCPGVGTTLDYNNHLYKAVIGTTTWDAAHTLAQSFTCCGSIGNLASITSAGENDFIRLNLGGVNGWIGFNDKVTEGTFAWTTGEAVTYTNWNAGEPNNAGNEDCAEIFGTGGKWNDLPCSSTTRTAFIIEFDCTDPKTRSPTAAPTAGPTAKPTAQPTALPTEAPTSLPTAGPTNVPTAVPTSKPTDKPTRFPTTTPTTAKPTFAPTPQPSAKPTTAPTSAPTFATVNCPGVGTTLDYNNHLYKAVIGTTTWDAAHTLAQSFTCCGSIGNLASINSAGENDFIRLNLGGVNGWIGFNDKVTEGVFEWTTGETVTYTNWNSGEPNNVGNEDCAEIFGTGGKWNDLPCSSATRNAFIIEFDCTDPKTRSPTAAPTAGPTAKPTLAPTPIPTAKPTAAPTSAPTYATVNCPGVGTTLDYNNHLYKAVTGTTTWDAAHAAAQSFSCCGSVGNLASITSAGENDFIRLNLGGVNGWIGFNDKVTEGVFEWTTGEAVAYTNWNSGEPNNSGNEDCAEIFGTVGKWNDLPCASTTRNAYIIEFDCTDPKTRSPTAAPTRPPTAKPTATPTRAPTSNPSASPTYADGTPVSCPSVGTAVSYHRHLYKAVSATLTWDQAEAEAATFSCCGRTGHLASVASSGENDFIRLSLGGVVAWIGFNDKATEGTFEWTTGEAVTYTNWNSGEPNNSGSNEDCAEINGPGGVWNDLPCSSTTRTSYIIEFDCP